MPSSTSNSNHRAPKAPYIKKALLTLALFVLLLTALEIHLRALGHLPSVQDTGMLWSIQRHQLEKHTKPQIVLVGASRMQLGIDEKQTRQLLPGHDLVQLAIDGNHGLPVLEDIALNSSFNGTVLFSFNSEIVLYDAPKSHDYVKDYHRFYSGPRWLDEHLDQWLTTGIQEHWVVANMSPVFLMKHRLSPAPAITWMDGRRFRMADYDRLSPPDLADLRKKRAGTVKHRGELPSPAEWLEKVEVMEGWVRAIEARGGRVVFIRFPSSGDRWRNDQVNFPREQYWDQLQTRFHFTTIHFKDEPSLAQIQCADFSHLDNQAAQEFTQNLFTLLQEKNLIQ